jgi:hypothetical protein
VHNVGPKIARPTSRLNKTTVGFAHQATLARANLFFAVLAFTG